MSRETVKGCHRPPAGPGTPSALSFRAIAAAERPPS